MAIDYTKSPNETVAQYNARIAAANPNLPAPGTTSSTGVKSTVPAPTTATTAPTYGVNGAVSVSSMGAPVTPFVVPPPPPAVTQDTASIVAAAQPSAETTAAQSGVDQTLANIQSLLEQQGGMAGRQGQLETQLGIPDLQQRLNEINQQIRGINSSAFSATQGAEGRLAPTFAILGEQAQIERQRSAQTFGLAAASSALQGNIALAQDQVKRAVDAEFGALQSRLDFQKLFLQANQDKLTKAQQKDAAVLQAKIADNQAKLDEQRANRSSIYDILVKAGQNATLFQSSAQFPNVNAALQAIQNATTPEAALQIATITGLLSSPSATGTTSSIQEYQFAVKNGYTGTFSQYQNEDANRKARVASAGIVTPGAPTSYKEWELAGKPGTYAQFLAEQNIKAPTAAQQTVATYAARIEQANPTIDTLASYITSLNPVQFELLQRTPSYLQTAQYQQFDQAARNFINANLRRESGAVISPTEFDNAYRQYLPRAGDTADVLAQKKANRDIVYASLRNAAGNAYQSVDQLLGVQTSTAPLKSGYQGTTSSGIQFTII